LVNVLKLVRLNQKWCYYC